MLRVFGKVRTVVVSSANFYSYSIRAEEQQASWFEIKKMKVTQPLMGGGMNGEKGVSIFDCVLAAVHSIGAATVSGEFHILLLRST